MLERDTTFNFTLLGERRQSSKSVERQSTSPFGQIRRRLRESLLILPFSVFLRSSGSKCTLPLSSYSQTHLKHTFPHLIVLSPRRSCMTGQSWSQFRASSPHTQPPWRTRENQEKSETPSIFGARRWTTVRPKIRSSMHCPQFVLEN